MLSICRVCLSTDKKLQSIGEPLDNWHDELCDFSIEDYAVYCAECTYLLKKFYNFKQKCLQANIILKKWKTQNPKIKNHIEQLKKELPQSSLSVQKIYSYSFQADTPESDNSILYSYLKISDNDDENNSEYLIDSVAGQNCISTKCGRKTIANARKTIGNLSNEGTDKKHDPNEKTNLLATYDSENEQELLNKSQVKVENEARSETDCVTKDFKIKSDDDSDFNLSDHVNDANDNNDDNDRDSDDDVDIQKLINDALKSDDSSDDEVLEKKRKRAPVEKKKVAKKTKTTNEKVKITDTDKSKGKRSKKKPAAKSDLEQIKFNIKSKFGNCEVKDAVGNVIDIDCIINNLDKMQNYTYNKIRKFCLDQKPLTPEAIQVFTRVQKKYGNLYSSVFDTDHLTTEQEIRKAFEKRLEHESYIQSDYKCTLCYRGFKHEKMLEYHMGAHHDNEKPHKCNLCAMRFSKATSLNSHVATHRVVYRCKLCPLVTNYTNVMESHYNIHNGVKYPCEFCDVVFKSPPSLAAHMNAVHRSRFICPYCARNFHSEHGLLTHRVKKHGNDKQPEGPPTAKCETCNITFISEEVLQKHEHKAHAGDNTHVFKTRKRTEQDAKKPPAFTCRVCGATETSTGGLLWHYKSMHPNENCDSVSLSRHGYKYLCHECGKGYSCVKDFREHKNIHTGAKPYACDKCPKTFHRRINLRLHKERHLPPKRECPHCGKMFISCSNLKNHMRAHTGIRRYICDLCTKGFLHRGALNAHVRGVHLNIKRTRKPARDQHLEG